MYSVCVSVCLEPKWVLLSNHWTKSFQTLAAEGTYHRLVGLLIWSWFDPEWLKPGHQCPWACCFAEELSPNKPNQTSFFLRESMSISFVMSLLWFQEGLKAARNLLHKDLPWVERLDLTTDLAPAPQALQDLEEIAEEENVHNDFQREMKLWVVKHSIKKRNKLSLTNNR